MSPSQPSESDEELNAAAWNYFESILRNHASELDARRWRWAFWGPAYHLFAGALFWIDEKPRGCRGGDAEDLLRALWHYRTGLIVGEKRPYGQLWRLAQQLCLNWVGFHPSRYKPRKFLFAVNRAGEAEAERLIADIEREMEFDATPPPSPASARGSSGRSARG